MKKGYIVWNETNYGSEFYGVYSSWDRAFRQFKRMVRSLYGKCPRGDYDSIMDWLVKTESGDDSLKITKFEEYTKNML